ncbi:hypothetical protein FBU59_002254 [Linderina macrospora]|uniref:Uncharacterized protein n=1 Tax=Linderina macrospora TaxID=4868 RepID=A0ACC1JBY3_9FUNG|nr:hypothetical protein FBU59_002254 [Linderina macrospora]
MTKTRRRSTKTVFGFDAGMPVPRAYTMFGSDELQAALGNEQDQAKLVQTYLFDPETWQELFSESQKNPVIKRALRVIVQMGTVAATLTHQYTVALTQEEVLLDRKRLQKSVSKTVYYASDDCFVSDFRNNGSAGWSEGRAAIRVVSADAIDVAEKLMELNPSHRAPAVLVFGAKSTPGGGYKRGAGSQEEDLVRRSALLHNLEDPYGFDPARDWSYPLPEFGGVYSPDVAVFRDAESKGYAFRDEALYLSFINVAPYSNVQANDVQYYGRLQSRIPDETMRRYMRKMEVILNIAREQGHRSVVLGAFGCAGQAALAVHMAQLWKEVIDASPYAFREFFDDIAFAIPDDSPGDDSPIEENSIASVFATAFGVELENLDFF